MRWIYMYPTDNRENKPSKQLTSDASDFVNYKAMQKTNLSDRRIVDLIHIAKK